MKDKRKLRIKIFTMICAITMIASSIIPTVYWIWLVFLNKR